MNDLNAYKDICKALVFFTSCDTICIDTSRSYLPGFNVEILNEKPNRLVDLNFLSGRFNVNRTLKTQKGGDEKFKEKIRKYFQKRTKT